MRTIRPYLLIGTLGFAVAAIAQSRPVKRETPNTVQTQPVPINPVSPIAFHGQLVDAEGNPVVSQVTLTFALYKQQASTSVYWSEQHSVTPQLGWFSVVLGDINSGGTEFPGDWDGTELWLGITVAGDAEMAPRTPLLPVAYAVIANPTQHAYTHGYGGTDELGANVSTPNELVRANDAGTIDPGWLPLAANGVPGVLPLSSGSLSPALLPEASPSAYGAVEVSSVEAANKVPVANAAGTLDPSWLPTATTSAYGAVEVSSTVASGKVPIGSNAGPLDPSWLPAASSTSNGAVEVSSTEAAGKVPIASNAGPLDPSWFPVATNMSYGAVEVSGTGAVGAVPIASGTGALDPSWLPAASSASNGAVEVSSAVASGKVPIGSNAGPLDPSWLPAASSTSNGAVEVSSTEAAGKVPIASNAGPLDPSWLPAASNSSNGAVQVSSTEAAGKVPIASGSGTLDTSWLPVTPVSKGGTGTSAPTVTRNLCIYTAGPQTGTASPTLMLPPALTGCSATGVFASSQTAPSSSATISFNRYTGGNSSQVASVLSTSWNAGSVFASSSSGSVALNSNDVYFVSYSAQVTNATACMQITCTAQFQ